MEHDFVTVDVFTDRRFGGNPLAVFPDARGLDGARMQALAAEFNLSETSFVLPPEDPSHTARVRIFTPKAELPFAGHPNVGTAFVLARRAEADGRRLESLAFEETAGLVPIRVLRDAAGRVRGAELEAPQPLSTGPEIPAELVAACAGLHVEEVATAAHPPVVASVGTAFVVAEIASVEALSRAAPDLAAFRHAADRASVAHALHLYAREAAGGRLRARMFWPLGGILEDPATGSANAALAALLASLRPDGAFAAEIAQGVEMGRPSLLRAEARRSADGVRARIGGDCVTVMRGRAEA